MNILFIGAGKMAAAMAGGMVHKGGFVSSELMAVDIADTSRKSFMDATGVECFESADKVIDQADVVILAVKPQCAQDAVANFAKNSQSKLIISIAAGIKISTLSEWLDSKRVVRVMPNTPLMIGEGASVFACGQDVSESDCLIVKSIFEPLGILRKMPENLMDAVTALSGSGPAYVFEMIQAMADAGVNAGLSADDALDLTVQTVLGSAKMVQQKMGTPDELRNAVTSPGGTTAAGLKVFQEADFRGLVNNVIKAARNRSVELGKK